MVRIRQDLYFFDLAALVIKILGCPLNTGQRTCIHKSIPTYGTVPIIYMVPVLELCLHIAGYGTYCSVTDIYCSTVRSVYRKNRMVLYAHVYCALSILIRQGSQAR